MKAVKVENISKTFKTKVKGAGFKNSIKSVFNPEYREIKAVDNISFSVEEGEILAYIGPNGAGKSTSIKMLTGILYPTSGSAEIMGLNPWKDRKKLSYKIGSVFGQKSQMWFHLPPADSFELMSDIYELDHHEYKKRISNLVKSFDLAEIMDIPVRKLSLGQRIRCEIAVSLLHNPKILFLDEPTIGLDVVVKNQVRELIKEANKNDNLTIFLTSHDVGDIEKLCKRVMVIDHGKIIHENTISELKRNYLRKKVIDLKLETPFNPQLEGITVIKNKDTGLKIEVNTDLCPIQKVINHINSVTTIQDMSVMDTPLEEVIHEIYTGSDKYEKVL